MIKEDQHQGLWKPNKNNLIYCINLKFHIAALDTLVRLTEIYIVYPLELIATMNYTLLKIRNDTIRATTSYTFGYNGDLTAIYVGAPL